VLASSYPEVSSGSDLPIHVIREAVPPEDNDVGSLFVPVRARDGKPYLLVFHIPDRTTALSLVPGIGAALIELSLLVFSGVMSFIAIRRLREGTRTLERATRRIGAGNYDEPVELAGSDELSQLARAFDQMRVTIRDEQQRSARFMMGISHDLKSPIGLIEGYAEAILDGHADTDEKLEHFAAVIKDRAALLEGRIKELIDLARLSTGEWRTRLADHRLASFLRGLVARYQSDAGLFGHELKVNIRLPEDVSVPLDPRLVERAIENILTNSFRYASPGSTVAVSARTETPEPDNPHSASSGRRAVIRVRNRTETDLSDKTEELFEPFWRDSTSRNEPGSGLGLSIARSIISSHGWSVGADAPEGAPSPEIEVVISIPLR
jgi:signal transduction histidine kinase